MKRITNKKLFYFGMTILVFLIIYSAATTFTPTEITAPKIVASELNSVFRVTGNTGADIQTALDTANAQGGGIVFVPPGTYSIDVPILLYDETYLEGVRGETVLTVNGNTFIGDAVIKSATRDGGLAVDTAITVSVKDLTIKVTGSLNNGNGVMGIDMTGMRHSRIANLDLHGSGLWEGIAILIGDYVEDPNNPVYLVHWYIQ